MKKGIGTILSTLTGALVGSAVGVAVYKQQQKESKKWKNMSDKHLALMCLFNQWMITKQEGKSVVDYFHNNGIKSVAIYGMSYLGERLLDELLTSDIEVKYAIDKNSISIYAKVDVISPDENIPMVDAIVVTPVFFYNEIEEMLSAKTECKIISLEDILYEI